jgi:DNA-binding MarR family transcriptional regulator
MEMHQLLSAVAVAQKGSFSRAAELCHVSQPSLSQQIQKLEGELRERLFDRMKRVAKLTPHGETLHQVASDVEEVLIERCGHYVPEERPVERSSWPVRSWTSSLNRPRAINDARMRSVKAMFNPLKGTQ